MADRGRSHAGGVRLSAACRRQAWWASAWRAALTAAEVSRLAPLKKTFRATAVIEARRIPDSISGWMACGIHWRKLGAISGTRPTPMDTATIMALKRLDLKSDRKS